MPFRKCKDSRKHYNLYKKLTKSWKTDPIICVATPEAIPKAKSGALPLRALDAPDLAFGMAFDNNFDPKPISIPKNIDLPILDYPNFV